MTKVDNKIVKKILLEKKHKNEYIQYIKDRTNNDFSLLTTFEKEYITKNYNYKPYVLNKIVRISSDFGFLLKKTYDIDFFPEKIYITKVIGEFENNVHCYIQYRKSVEPKLLLLGKYYIIGDIRPSNEVFDVDVDFSIYDNKTKHTGRFLKEVQKEGINFLLKNKKCILADSMGCGKTTTSIVSAMETKQDKVLIICPASLKSNWKKELMVYNDEKDITIINGKKWVSNTKFIIVNYDILDNFYFIPSRKNYKLLNNGKIKSNVKSKQIEEFCLNKSPLYLEDFGCVIIDEAHKLSNDTSIRYEVINDFLKRSNTPYVFLLTGTPMTNRPINLYNVLKLINSNVSSDFNYYIHRYCDAKRIKLENGRKITLMNGATNLEELRDKIKHVYIRRMLHEMTKMVNKNIETRCYSLSDEQLETYNKLWEEYVNKKQEEGKEKEDTEEYKKLVEGIIVRQYLAKEMIPNTIKLVDEKLEEGEKVIIICTFSDEIEELKKYYGDKAVVYDGKMTIKKKDKAEHDFMNNDDVKVFIGQIIACSVGLTLTIAHTLIFNSYSWVAADNYQAEDRIYRLNQTEDVTCIYQLFDDSISKDMFEKVMYKGDIMKQTIKSENEKKIN